MNARLEDARARFPGVDVDAETFVARLATHDRLPSFDGAAEIFLALGCALDQAPAIGAFMTTYLGNLGPMLVGLGVRSADVEDVVQAVAERLLAKTAAGSIKLLEYAGEGRLRGFVRVVATRWVHNDRRSSTRRDDREQQAQLTEHAIDDPELLLTKARYQEAFASAFEVALGRLDPAGRSLLRLHLVDHLSVTQLGAALGVHRATAARRLKAARELVRDETAAELRRLLQGDPKFEGVLRLVPSRLDLSVGRLLGESGG